ncbi:MAG: Hsp20/alpha crystallin family protein [Gemmatimonadota bacterium]
MLRPPSADILETRTELRVVLELAGVSPDNIEIQLANNVLTITGVKKDEEARDDDGEFRWHISERRFGSFSRSFVLPSPVEEEDVTASFSEGILRIVILKKVTARPRSIGIETPATGEESDFEVDDRLLAELRSAEESPKAIVGLLDLTFADIEAFVETEDLTPDEAKLAEELRSAAEFRQG